MHDAVQKEDYCDLKLRGVKTMPNKVVEGNLDAKGLKFASW